MALELFDFPFHTVQTNNPESGMRGTMGGSYVFTAAPTDPDQRQFTLTFATMKYFFDSSNVLDETINPQYNMLALAQFYQRHKTYKSFHYEHPVYGTMECKFNKPLVEPESLPGGSGATKAVTVELIEIP